MYLSLAMMEKSNSAVGRGVAEYDEAPVDNLSNRGDRAQAPDRWVSRAKVVVALTGNATWIDRGATLDSLPGSNVEQASG